MNEPTPPPSLESLFALARTHRPDTSRAEYGFETRLMARLRAGRDHGALWSLTARVSWRVIPFLAACVVALTLWQAETNADVSDATDIAGISNPLAADLSSN
jgi:hypothetical protein